MKKALLGFLFLSVSVFVQAQKIPLASSPTVELSTYFKPLKWRNIGPFRGGRSVTACGDLSDPQVYYMGTCSGGLWKTEDAGQGWFNVSDGYFKTGSVGAVAVADSDPNIVYVGMGEHAPRGVMTSYGDGVYKSTDAGKTWTHLGLELTRHVAWIRIHPQNPDMVYVAAQGALHGPNPERGVYRSTDGGKNWQKVLYVDENTGCADLAMDPSNALVLYAAMWDHRRLPWLVRSGGKGSGLYKSVDGGATWAKLTNGIPTELGKMSIALAKAEPDRVYALIESDTEKELGGLFASDNAGASFTRVSTDHRLTQRAWYYVEMTVDPQNEQVLYVLNSPALKSIDGGHSWAPFSARHGDHHQLWINPQNSKNMVMANDGGATITFNGGASWSSQDNQPTAQFYRVNADFLFPYNLYGGQQDNTSVKISSRNLTDGAIGDKDWGYSAGGESAFLAFDRRNPTKVMGGSYQGTIELMDTKTQERKPVMVAPIQYQALQPKEMKYRFNWNAPVVYNSQQKAFYHAANVVFKTTNLGNSWEVISPDLTRNDTSKQGTSGLPYTNEGAGGENYGTIAYLADSPHDPSVLYAGSDDGLIHLTRDAGKSWLNITPPQWGETLVNCIEVSPHDQATAYVATTRYKVNDFAPSLFKTTDYGKTWKKIDKGIPYGAYTRCIREDKQRKGLLFAGTETGLFISFNDGENWQPLQLGLPITPVTDLLVHENDLIAATMGRSFWILDQLAPLQQYKLGQNLGQSLLYQPEAAHRVGAFGGPDDGTDAPANAKPKFNGDNPANGVVIFYQLPTGFAETTPLKLEILDIKGEVVRVFSTKPHPDFSQYPGGPNPEPLLPAKAGLNKFVWDMRAPILPGVPTVFIEGSYEGHKVSPGQYTLRLHVGSQTLETKATILPHPGIEATEADYAEQADWHAKVDAEFTDIHTAVLRMRKVRQQISGVVSLLADAVAHAALGKEAQALVAKLTRWEDALVQNKAKSNDDIINYVNRLSADYLFLKYELDSNTPQVTAGQKAQFAALHVRWAASQATLATLLQSVTAFNQTCQKAGLQTIIVP